MKRAELKITDLIWSKLSKNKDLKEIRQNVNSGFPGW